MAESNEFQHRCFGFDNGTDGIVPPTHMDFSFDSSTTHYEWGATVIESGDIEAMIRVITI